MSFLTKHFLVCVFFVAFESFVRAETESASAEIILEKTMGSTDTDKLIYQCSCNSVSEVVGALPCDELWDNHVQEKFEENLALLKQYGMPDNWSSVDILSRVESQCALFVDVSIPLFECYTGQIQSNATLPVEELRINWLYNKPAENTKILEQYGALEPGDNDAKGSLDALFIKCLRSTIQARQTTASTGTKLIDIVNGIL